jgi:hypothetical protein
MIDVHPTHHGSFTRRDFFIHLGIVVLGILIAIGLEQTVEHVHRLHQRHGLEETLHSETILNRRIVAYNIDSVDQVRRNIRLNMTNLDLNGKSFAPVPPAHDTFLPLIDTAWVVARGNGSLALLPDQLAESYWTVDVCAQEAANSIQSLANARKKVNSLLYLHAKHSDLTAEERAALLRAYSEEDQELGNLNYILLAYQYLNEAVLAGRAPTVDDLAKESRDAQKTEAQPPQP